MTQSTQNPTLDQSRGQAGWWIVVSIFTTGTSYLCRLFLLFKIGSTRFERHSIGALEIGVACGWMWRRSKTPRKSFKCMNPLHTGHRLSARTIVTSNCKPRTTGLIGFREHGVSLGIRVGGISYERPKTLRNASTTREQTHPSTRCQYPNTSASTSRYIQQRSKWRTQQIPVVEAQFLALTPCATGFLGHGVTLPGHHPCGYTCVP